MISPFIPRFPHLRLTMQTIIDELDELSWHFTCKADDTPLFRGFVVYSRGSVLRDDILYCVDAPDAASFPGNDHPYITPAGSCGSAPHICGLNQTMFSLCNALNRIFLRYHEFESELSSLVQNGGDLDDICRLGSSFFQNPMYIHDNLFTILAQPCFAEGMLVPDVNPETGKKYVPLWLIEDFKFNTGYTDTLRQTNAQIWGNDQYPYHIRSLYVNIWDGDYYRARLLINELHTPLLPSQFRLAEFLAQYILLILRMDEQQTNRHYHNLEDTVKSIMGGYKVDRSDLRILLTALGWREDDSYMCIKCQTQSSSISLTADNAIRSALSTVLPENFSYFYEQRLCIIVNLTTARISPAGVRSKLAPLLRDSYMYGGFSNPVPDFLSILHAFRQTDIALQQTLDDRSSRWFCSFEDCALNYLLENLNSPIPRPLLASPVLVVLQKTDAEHGTSYYRTLRTYLTLERSIPRTSEALIIHRSTLLYRLEKIREITNVNLDDETQRLYLLLSFRLLDDDVPSAP